MPHLSSNLALPYLSPSQAQKHITHNEALQILDAVVQLAVLASDLGTPPAAVNTGARYIVGASANWCMDYTRRPSGTMDGGGMDIPETPPRVARLGERHQH